ncbi:MAG: type II secretion system F family protein [Phycisphaerae bacterium]
MKFAYEAMTRAGVMQTDVIEASAADAALEVLRSKGLTPIKVTQAAEKSGAQARPGRFSRPGGRDLLLFTRQMKMLLESGSAVVPALEAVEAQTKKPVMKQVLHQIRDHVENGGSLSDAMRIRHDVFRPVFISMIAAGEATAMLPRSFGRLADLTYRQEQTRKTVIGALVYPLVLSILCLGVVAVLIGFVVPRFKTLFTNLNANMPTSTMIMFAVADIARDYWPFMAGGVVAFVIGAIFALRQRIVREMLDHVLIGAPGVGAVACRLEFARIVRVWAAMLRSNVPLLETLDQSRAAALTICYQRMIDKLRESVSTGNRVGDVLRHSNLVDPVIASAIATGEENGRMAEACEFVSSWMDDDNDSAIASLTRVIEPVMLAFMGVFVGMVAMGLFLPLFDMAGIG